MNSGGFKQGFWKAQPPTPRGRRMWVACVLELSADGAISKRQVLGTYTRETPRDVHGRGARRRAHRARVKAALKQAIGG